VTYLYISMHLLAAVLFLKSKPLEAMFGFFAIISSIFIFICQPVTYDINSYIAAVDNVSGFEPIFAEIIELISLFQPVSSKVVQIIQWGLVFMTPIILLYFKRRYLLLLGIVLSSVAFMLAFGNVLRQGFASFFLILSLLFLLRKQFAFSLICVVLAQGFHSSSFYFAVFNYSLYIAHMRGLFPRQLVLSFFYIFSFSLGLALISNYLINQSIYAGYIGTDMSGGERTGLLAKSLILLVIFVVSENILKFRSISSEIDYLRKLRAFFLFLPIALALIGSYEEIGSRILYYFFWVELILLLLLAERGFNKTIAFVLVSYAFAFNVWNNLGGL
jgi:hypothetical protein